MTGAPPQKQGLPPAASLLKVEDGQNDKENRTPALKRVNWGNDATTAIVTSPTTGLKKPATERDAGIGKEGSEIEGDGKEKEDGERKEKGQWGNIITSLRERQRNALGDNNNVRPRILRIRMGEGKALRKVTPAGD